MAGRESPAAGTRGDKSLAVLIVDDEQVVRDVLRRFLQAKNIVVDTAEDGAIALEKIQQQAFDIVLTDLQMPRQGGMDVLRHIKQLQPQVEVVIISGYPTIVAAVEAIKNGARDFICKPFDLEQVYTVIQSCGRYQRAYSGVMRYEELQVLVDHCRDIVNEREQQRIVERLLATAVSLTTAGRGSVMRYVPETNELRIVAARGIDPEIIAQTRVRLGEGISGAIAGSQAAVLVTRCAEEIRQAHSGYTYRSESFICIPLCVLVNGERRIFGVLNVADPIDEGEFTVREKQLLTIAAATACLALEHG